MKLKKTLSSWLTTRYLLVIRNEENLSEKTTTSFTYAKVIVVATFTFIVTMALSLLLVRTVLAQWFDPQTAQLEANRKLLQLKMSVDSLALQVKKEKLYNANVMRILRGEDAVYGSSEEGGTPVSVTSADINSNYELDPIDSAFREEFQGFTNNDLRYSESNEEEFNSIFLFSPLVGYVSASYDAALGHYGVDIVARQDEPVKCVSDGTVIFSEWTQDSGYVMVVQHSNNFLSVYKHNSSLLKKVGNFVRSGEIIAIIGNTGELTTGPHLHFELWINGSPVDPEEFVSF